MKALGFEALLVGMHLASAVAAAREPAHARTSIPTEVSDEMRERLRALGYLE